MSHVVAHHVTLSGMSSYTEISVLVLDPISWHAIRCGEEDAVLITAPQGATMAIGTATAACDSTAYTRQS